MQKVEVDMANSTEKPSPRLQELMVVLKKPCAHMKRLVFACVDA